MTFRVSRSFLAVFFAAALFADTSDAFCPTSSLSQNHASNTNSHILHMAVQQEDEGIVLGHKYLLDDDLAETSTSGKSTLVEAVSHTAYDGTQNQNDKSQGYGSDATATKSMDDKVLVKFSDNIKALKREARIYNKIAGEDEYKDLFVTIHDFYNPQEKKKNEKEKEKLSDSTTKEETFFDTRTQSLQPISKAKVTFKGQAALVMERGTQDLKSYIRENGPMKGKALRDAVVTTARTLKAFHAKKKVWTELKSANFVMIPETGEGPLNKHVLKAIDLESAVPKGQPPIDFSPEAIPPEFAKAYLLEVEHKMEMQKSFDIFSLGLLWYEMATGVQYWQREFFQDQQECDDALRIAHGMKHRNEICLEHVSDKLEKPLRELIEKCLRVNPEERPKIDEVLAHPYIAEMLPSV